MEWIGVGPNQISMMEPTVLQRCHSVMVQEYPVKVGQVRDTAIASDITDNVVGRNEPTGGVLHAMKIHKNGWRHPKIALECPAHVWV